MQMQVAAGNSCTIIYLFSIGEDSEGKMMQSMVLHFLLSYRSAVVCLFVCIDYCIYLFSRGVEGVRPDYRSDRITVGSGFLSPLLSSHPLLQLQHEPSFDTKVSKSQSQSILLPFLRLPPSNTSASLFSSSRSHPPSTSSTVSGQEPVRLLRSNRRQSITPRSLSYHGFSTSPSSKLSTLIFLIPIHSSVHEAHRHAIQVSALH